MLAESFGILGKEDDVHTFLVEVLVVVMSREENTYRHHWEPGMVALWDNRCLIHSATGGYQGHRRELHRLTIADRTPTASMT